MPSQRFTETAYSVRLFMPHGDPDGLRVIDLPSWSGLGIAFPRAACKEVSQRDEFERTGVYILAGPDPDGSVLPGLYITDQYMSILRKDWIEQGVMVPDGKFFRMTRAYDLSSPSTAASVLLGRAANGRVEWKDDRGRTLREIQEAEAQN